MKIKVVKMNPGGDSVTALYVDDRLRVQGDQYHDKISDWIKGFLAGLKFARDEGWYQVVHVETWYIPDRYFTEYDLEELMSCPPLLFENLPTEFLTKEY